MGAISGKGWYEFNKEYASIVRIRDTQLPGTSILAAAARSGFEVGVKKPDRIWPGMWRVCLPDGHLTDMVNLSRAKDAAASLALAALNRHREAA